MSLLKRIVGAIRSEPETVPEPLAFGVTETGQGRLGTLGHGHGVIIGRRGEDGPVIDLAVREAPTVDRVTVDGVDPERLRGLLLDWDPIRNQWRLVLDFSLRAGGTPNPNGRLYKASRRLAGDVPAFFTRSTVNPWLVDRLLDHADVATVLLRAHTLTVNRSSAADEWTALDSHVDQTLRRYLLGAGRLIDTERRPRYANALEQAVAEVLQERILPTVHRDGGNLELVEVREGIVRLSLVGACRDCPSSAMTLHRGVESVLKRAFPDRVRGVEAV